MARDTIDLVWSDSRPLVPSEATFDWLQQLKKPVAVTGGTGFVGSHLVDTLCDAGVRPRVLKTHAGLRVRFTRVVPGLERRDIR